MQLCYDASAKIIIFGRNSRFAYLNDEFRVQKETKSTLNLFIETFASQDEINVIEMEMDEI